MIPTTLSVIIFKESSAAYIAHSRELDYAAQGDTINNAKERFARGLLATVHIRRLRKNVEHYDPPCPPQLWEELCKHPDSKRYKFTMNPETNSITWVDSN